MPEPLTKEQIIAIAKSKGCFHVGLRYRDDRLRERCKRMVKDGLLFKAPRWMIKRKFYGDPRKGSWFILTKETSE